MRVFPVLRYDSSGASLLRTIEDETYKKEPTIIVQSDYVEYHTCSLRYRDGDCVAIHILRDETSVLCTALRDIDDL